MSETKLNALPAAVQRLGVSRATGWRLIKNGQMRAIRIGKRVLIPESEIERLMNSGTDSKRSAA
jgi:excisionase family DNA binding protein